jgi:hypothetical protein
MDDRSPRRERRSPRSAALHRRTAAVTAIAARSNAFWFAPAPPLTPAVCRVLFFGTLLLWSCRRLLYNAPLYAAHAARGVGDRRGERSAAGTGAGAAARH